MVLSADKIVFQWLRLSSFLFLFVLVSCNESEEVSVDDTVQEEEYEPLPFFNTADLTPEWIEKNDAGYDSIHCIAPFSFLDQKGNVFDNSKVEGKIYVANFFFTTCAGICPKMSDNMVLVQDAFLGDDEVLMLSHTVMPWLDTVSKLNTYAHERDAEYGQWYFLTGEKETIYDLARTSYFAEKRLGLQKDTDEFLHTENFFLIDREGRIRGVYNGTLEAEIDRLIEAIHILKKEQA